MGLGSAALTGFATTAASMPLAGIVDSLCFRDSPGLNAVGEVKLTGFLASKEFSETSTGHVLVNRQFKGLNGLFFGGESLKEVIKVQTLKNESRIGIEAEEFEVAAPGPGLVDIVNEA